MGAFFIILLKIIFDRIKKKIEPFHVHFHIDCIYQNTEDVQKDTFKIIALKKYTDVQWSLKSIQMHSIQMYSDQERYEFSLLLRHTTIEMSRLHILHKS